MYLKNPNLIKIIYFNISKILYIKGFVVCISNSICLYVFTFSIYFHFVLIQSKCGQKWQALGKWGLF